MKERLIDASIEELLITMEDSPSAEQSKILGMIVRFSSEKMIFYLY